MSDTPDSPHITPQLVPDVEETKTTRDEAVKEMLESLKEFFKTEISTSCEEYHLLEKLNLSTASRYESMAEQAKVMLTIMSDLVVKRQSLQVHFDQIDELCAAIENLQTVVKSLDQYVESIENHITSMVNSAQ